MALQQRLLVMFILRFTIAFLCICVWIKTLDLQNMQPINYINPYIPQSFSFVFVEELARKKKAILSMSAQRIIIRLEENVDSLPLGVHEWKIGTADSLWQICLIEIDSLRQGCSVLSHIFIICFVFFAVSATLLQVEYG